MATQYVVFRPNAGIVSRHRAITAALRALKRQREGAAKQGGFSDDRVMAEENGQLRGLRSDEYDPDWDLTND